ncbi:MAG TPA: hypothetical protein VGK24_05530 [Candidatus Angelobacter sp.]|jgi:hypothetical protein
MTTFADLRTQLAQARTQKSAADAQAALQNAQLKSIESQIATLSRQSGGQTSHSLAGLQKQAATLTTQITASRRQAGQFQTSASQLLGQIAQLQDPTQQLSELNDRIPILLFPVRLEVRFRKAAPIQTPPVPISAVPTPGVPARGPAAAASAVIVGTAPQLWIRIYPDDCQIDSFETMLTDVEVQNLTAFWIAMWRAGSVEAQERGAWRSLLAGSGSGRAAYIVSQYAPSNPADKPVKANPQDVVLVIVPHTAVTADEQSKTFDYWIAVWKADGDSTQEQAALTTLQGEVGNARAAQLIAQFPPDPNGWNPPQPYTRAQVNVTCSVLQLPAAPVTKQTSWTQAPHMVAQPDRFVALLYSGTTVVKTVIGNPIPDDLTTGPDPSLPQADQIHLTNDDLVLDDNLKWLADFDRAVSVGMGFKIDLTPEQAQTGFDRLLVVGVRISSDETASRQMLETLIAHQYSVPGGYSLVPQGSPTNNTSSAGAAYTWVDDPDVAYETVFKGKEAYVESADPLQKHDGQWLAEALGINDALMKLVPNAAGVDQLEARAMNIALWNGTLGYMMEEMMAPLFSAADIVSTRLFFTRYVAGRGPLPAVRVGNQPYGILPVTSFANYRSTPSRVTGAQLASPLPAADYLQRLHTLLARMDKDWLTMSAAVARVGQPGDAHQVLLDIVGLNSGSVEYYQRYAESFEQLYNKLVLELGGFFGTLLAGFIKNNRQAVLTALGGDPTADPPILDKFFYGPNALLTGPVVDDAPLSELKPIRAYTPDKKNYVQWLAAASLDVIRRQDFGGNPEPTALLYLMLRHSMMLAQWDVGTRFLEERAIVDSAVARAEPAFINVQTAAAGGQSKFQNLYQPQPAITGSATQTLAEYVLSPGVLGVAPETEPLSEMIAALNVLAGSSTARLERVFAEHIDCCSYRLDAWKTGLATVRLAEMRANADSKVPPGIYLGAFGWLENVKPKTELLTTPSLTPDQAKDFQRPGDAPLQYDSQNAGYIHAPSLSQAAAAAILKNAYRVNATPANPDAMAVNLSSERVRQAQTILEGMRNGQTLAALLGYRFERGLHDDHSLAEVDKFIYPLRQVFPLVANQLKSTADPTADITLLEARNVIDGVQLVNRMRTPGNATYPFGFPTDPNPGPGQLLPASAPEATAINTEADRFLNLYDALGDLVMAESVYQVVLGNFDRSAAVSTAFSTGAPPPEMHVVETRRTGFSLTHRVALHLDVTADPATSPNSVPMTPRAAAEAPLNAWLNGRLPAPPQVTVSVTYSTPALAAPKPIIITQDDLKLQPVDLLYLVNLDLDQAMAELDDRILQIVRYGTDAHPDMAITINYTQLAPGQITFFEIAALVRSLREVVLKSRAAGPTDMAMPLDSKSDEAVWDDVELQGRIQTAINGLTARRDALVTLETDASDLDAYLQLASAELLRTALYGMPQCGTGGMHSDVRAIYEAIAKKINDIVVRWEKKSSDYAALLISYPTLTNDPDRFALLRQAERLISATATPVPPPNPDDYKNAIDLVKTTQFNPRLAQFQALLKWSGARLVDFAAAAEAMKPLAAIHDVIPFDISDQDAAITALRASIVAKVTAAAADLSQRITDANNALAGLSGIQSSQARVQQLLAAGKRVLGSEMQLVPRFQLSSDHAAEFDNGWSGSPALLTDLLAAGRRFPVDDWLYGLARVRSKLSAWENVIVLSEAFGSAPAELTPVQLPFVARDRWTALEFDTANATTNDRLLYTAHFTKPFQPAGDQCALIIDEWPEVVPVDDMVSGLAFHFDRPNSQPPQTMLLAVPPVLRGNWNWNDLVAMLNQTLDDARKRGVEPALIDSSNYAQFLPATVMAVTLFQITIATNLALNNRIYDFIGDQ